MRTVAHKSVDRKLLGEPWKEADCVKYFDPYLNFVPCSILSSSLW
jgi:hypothetical protein